MLAPAGSQKAASGWALTRDAIESLTFRTKAGTSRNATSLLTFHATEINTLGFSDTIALIRRSKLSIFAGVTSTSIVCNVTWETPDALDTTKSSASCLHSRGTDTLVLTWCGLDLAAWALCYTCALCHVHMTSTDLTIVQTAWIIGSWQTLFTGTAINI